MKLKLEAQVVVYDDINKNVWVAVEDESGCKYLVKGGIDTELNMHFVGQNSIIKSRTCSCGALKSNTTHSDWCDFHA